MLYKKRRGEKIKAKTKVLILLSLMVILCSLTAINASDINDTSDNSLTNSNNENAINQGAAITDTNQISSSLSKTINKNDNSKSLKADSDKGTFEQLQKLIDDADEDSTIYLDKDYANSKNTFFKTSVNVKKKQSQ